MRHQITARVPELDFRLLQALAAVLNTSQADVVSRGLHALRDALPASTRRLVTALRRSLRRQQK